MLQQCLPLAVLKPFYRLLLALQRRKVATVLTACGIETFMKTASLQFVATTLQQCLPLAVLKLLYEIKNVEGKLPSVATVLTACGIETYSTQE